MEIFAKKLKELRTMSGLSQGQLAEILDVTIPTISHWECNYQEPSLKDVKKICLFFNESADYLLGIVDIDGHKIEEKDS